MLLPECCCFCLQLWQPLVQFVLHLLTQAALAQHGELHMKPNTQWPYCPSDWLSRKLEAYEGPEGGRKPLTNEDCRPTACRVFLTTF